MVEEECEGCSTGIEPNVSEGEVQQPEVSEGGVEETVQQPEANEEKIPEVAEIAGALGLMTSVCQISPEEVREACWQEIVPLEEGKKSPQETIKAYAAAHGTEELEKSLEVLKKLIEAAKKEVEQK